MNELDIGQGGGKGEVSLLVNSGKNSDKSVALKFHGGLRKKISKKISWGGDNEKWVEKADLAYLK